MENTDQKRTVYTVKMIADEGFNEDYNVTSETSKCLGFAIKINFLENSVVLTTTGKLVLCEGGGRKKIRKVRTDALLLSAGRASTFTRSRTSCDS